MGSCEGCLEVYPGLPDGVTCSKCKKLAKGLTKVEVEALQVFNSLIDILTSSNVRVPKRQPSCRHCGAHSPFLPGRYCGGCSARGHGEERDEDPSTVATHVGQRAQAFSSSASEHRLNQPKSQPKQKLNPNLLKAATLNTQKTRLKNLTKAQTIHVELSLMLLDEKGKNHKCQLAPFPDTFDVNDPIDAALLTLSEKLKTNFLQSPYSCQFPDADFDFSFANCMLNSLSGRKSLSIDKKAISFKANLESLYTHLVNSGHLSNMDKDARRLCLQIVVPISWDTDDHDLSSKPSRTTRKRKLSSESATSSRPGSVHGSSYSSKWNRTSRPRHAIEYETFIFKKTVCHLSSSGDTSFEILANTHEIEVAKGWLQFVKGGQPDGGYISKGLYKYAVLARYQGEQMALFMHKPASSSTQLNNAALHAELDLLVQGDGFAQSFKARAVVENVTLPEIGYNARNGFVGTIQSFLPATPLPVNDKAIEEQVDAADCSLLYDTFLVVPLLQTKGLYKERKFSGNTETGNSSDYIGEVVDAFAHHVLEETNCTLMLADIQGVVGPDRSITLFDPQSHSIASDTGEWDQGSDAIKKFCKEHCCNKVCRQLKLKDLQKKPHKGPHRPWE